MNHKEIVHSTVARTLGVPAVDGSASFFDLGGDSLSALRVITLLEQQLGHTLDIVDLLTAPTLDDYAADLPAAAGHA
ncbi:acyl carrier protein [Catenuloplanes atrovinosus]|uniref:Acyl carrier protein n=1 Tax=Catenuloplanes atrovinosus TaxID=137266 RepID=A0AAE4CBG7_9ACTN|nr:acyl carrier protein [Catenuloplanes atrovinosus]MDR7275595.1 acyl carrier protein [Catenuloplanes atrovinosus]